MDGAKASRPFLLFHLYHSHLPQTTCPARSLHERFLFVETAIITRHDHRCGAVTTPKLAHEWVNDWCERHR